MTDGKKMNEESLSGNHRLRREGRKRRNVSMGKAKRASVKEDDDLLKNKLSFFELHFSRFQIEDELSHSQIKMPTTHVQFTPIQSR